MRPIFLTLVLLWSVPLFAQTGNYFLSNYTPHTERASNVCFGMAQDERGVLYFATKSGILQFDGRDWDLINGTESVYTLTISPSNEIYWGGSNGFGKIGHDENGFQKIQLLSVRVNDVVESVFIKDQVHFLTDDALLSYDTQSSKTTTLKSTPLTGPFLGLFELFGKAYVTTQHSGVLMVDQQKLIKSNLILPGNSEVIFTASLNNNYLIGTSDNHIFFCRPDLKLHEITLEDQKYADASVVISGSWINQQLVALGTLRGGVIFFNPATGKTEQIINYATGLPDNEVFALMSDHHQNIWIAHDYGFTRATPYLPLRSFSHYAGLQGNLLCAISFQDQVYVGTSLGLFKLEKEEVYDEIIYYVDVLASDTRKEKKIPEKKVEVVKPAEISQAVQVEVESKKKGLFSFLRRSKNKKEKLAEEKTVVVEERTLTETVAKIFARKKPAYKREKKVQKILRSSQFVYKKVQGIDAKITQLIEANGKLIAAGLGGAYEVNALVSKTLLDEPVRFVFANEKILLAATYEDEVRSWSLKEKNWQSINLLDTLDAEINYIFEGTKDELWLCAFNKIYKLELSGDRLKNIRAYYLPNTHADESSGIQWHNQTFLVNSEGFFKYNRAKEKIVKIDTLPKPKVYFAGMKNLWYCDEHNWKSLGTKEEPSNLQLLNLFQDLRFITPDNQNNLWLITGNNELFKFFGERINPYDAGYPLLLKSIHNADKPIGISNKIKIDQQQSSLSIEVVQPNYIGAESIEYRYFLKGLHKTWSGWANNNSTVNFPYLPPGEYKLMVQSKDIFGRVSELKPLTFQVRPPYWQRPWFYALEFVVFALLVLLSFRLSTKYIIISRLLSLLTIILLIQFIQTVATSIFLTKASPVFDFFIQVLVALVILPVEGYLRRLMLQSVDSGTGLRQLIITKKDRPTNSNQTGR